MKYSSMIALILFLAGAAFAEKGVFDYEGQKKAGPDVKKIVYIGDAGTHGKIGNHEFMAAGMLIGRALNAHYPRAHMVVHSSKNWPKDLSHADAVIVALNHGGKAAQDANIAAAMKRGAGFMAIHFGVEVNKGEQGDNFTEWMGGYFETFWSVNPWWTPEFKSFTKHPATRGVKPFSLRDEWYYHMRFKNGMKGITPILAAVAPMNTLHGSPDKPSGRGINPDVHAAVSAGKAQLLAWACERPDGGRGFGFTGMHDHNNHANDSFRTVLMNGAAWVTKLEVPENGVPSPAQTKESLTALAKEAREAINNGK